MAKKKTPKAESETPENTAPEKATDPNPDPTDAAAPDDKTSDASPETPQSGKAGEPRAVEDTAESTPEADPNDDTPEPAKTDMPDLKATDKAETADSVDPEEAVDDAKAPITDETATDPDTPESAPETDQQDDRDGADLEKDTDEPVQSSIPDTSKDRRADASSEAPADAPRKVEQVVVRKGGFLPMLFGGLIAAGLGFAASHYEILQGAGSDLAPRVEELSSELSLQAQTIDGLSARLDALPASPDLAPLDSRIAEIAAQAADLGASVGANEAEIAALSNRLDELDARLSDVERAPVSAEASEAAVEAYERELEAARAQIAEQRAEMDAQQAELAAMIDEAKSTENEAEEAEMQALRRAAISRITGALESGTAFADAITELDATGLDVPGPLTAMAETGVPTATELQDSFPDVARAALSASRQAAVDSGEIGGFSDFLRSQLGARSLEPQEGDDPDAVLSRAEAAVRSGDFAAAMDELDALPEAARTEVADWEARADRRLEALDAARTLREKLN